MLRFALFLHMLRKMSAGASGVTFQEGVPTAAKGDCCRTRRDDDRSLIVGPPEATNVTPDGLGLETGLASPAGWKLVCT